MFQPKFQITNHLIAKLESIAQYKGKIDGALIDVAWLPKLVRETITRVVHSSTAIEGNTLSIREVEMIADGLDLPQKSTKEKQEVKNYLAVLKYILENSNIKEFQEKDIFKLHSIIGSNDALDRPPIGSYRTYQVYVGSHMPVPFGKVKSMTKDLLGWINLEGIKASPVISSAIIQYQFETIHPFGDGNGRVGRAWAVWELYRRGFDSKHIFAVDEIFHENRSHYYKALEIGQKKGDDADLTGWIEFVAESTEWALQKAWDRIRKYKVNQKVILTPNQEKLLQALENGALTIQEILKYLQVTKAGAHFIIRPLLKADLIIRQGGHIKGKYLLKK